MLLGILSIDQAIMAAAVGAAIGMLLADYTWRRRDGGSE